MYRTALSDETIPEITHVRSVAHALKPLGQLLLL